MIQFSLCSARVGGCIFGQGGFMGQNVSGERLSAFLMSFAFRARLESVSRYGN
jgi:hypothetical protein